jgi:hypothetical protein
VFDVFVQFIHGSSTWVHTEDEHCETNFVDTVSTLEMRLDWLRMTLSLKLAGIGQNWLELAAACGIGNLQPNSRGRIGYAGSELGLLDIGCYDVVTRNSGNWNWLELAGIGYNWLQLAAIGELENSAQFWARIGFTRLELGLLILVRSMILCIP